MIACDSWWSNKSASFNYHQVSLTIMRHLTRAWLWKEIKTISNFCLCMKPYNYYEVKNNDKYIVLCIKKLTIALIKNIHLSFWLNPLIQEKFKINLTFNSIIKLWIEVHKKINVLFLQRIGLAELQLSLNLKVILWCIIIYVMYTW